MWAARYWSPRYWASRFWSHFGQDVEIVHESGTLEIGAEFTGQERVTDGIVPVGQAVLRRIPPPPKKKRKRELVHAAGDLSFGFEFSGEHSITTDPVFEATMRRRRQIAEEEEMILLGVIE